MGFKISSIMRIDIRLQIADNVKNQCLILGRNIPCILNVERVKNAWVTYWLNCTLTQILDIWLGKTISELMLLCWSRCAARSSPR